MTQPNAEVRTNQFQPKMLSLWISNFQILPPSLGGRTTSKKKVENGSQASAPITFIVYVGIASEINKGAS